MSTSQAPSLLSSNQQEAQPLFNTVEGEATTLLDLLYDGFVMLFLLRRKQSPAGAEQFLGNIRSYLAEFERNAKKLHATPEEIYAAKYAFCAAVDEFVLRTPEFAVRTEWERRPLQLVLFGDQLAGENFFEMLEKERSQGASRVQVLEVFYMCLLLGFQGKYIIEGQEKLNYLTARLGDEIANMKGKRAAFAPHWPLPDQISHSIRRDTPEWVVAAVFSLIALIGFIGLSTHLKHETQGMLSSYQELVRLGPKPVNLTISLP